MPQKIRLRGTPLVSGTVFRGTSRRHRHWPSFAVASRPISSGAAFHDHSPFSCRAREVTCHYGHVNRFCYLLTESDMNCTVASDLNQPSRSFELFWSETKCRLLFRSLIESSGDVTKADIVHNLESPFKVILCTISGFIVCISKIQHIQGGPH